jgi:hypothetical protein
LDTSLIIADICLLIAGVISPSRSALDGGSPRAYYFGTTPEGIGGGDIENSVPHIWQTQTATLLLPAAIVRLTRF